MVDGKAVDCVVLNWRDDERTRRCVASLLRDPLVSRVLIVDNESEGHLRDTVHDRGGRITLIESTENLGFAGGVNKGILACLDSGGTHVLVLNNDVEVPAGVIGTLQSAMATDPRLAFVAPRTIAPSGVTISCGGRLRRWTMAIDELDQGRLDFVTWACVLLDKSKLRQTGLLNERFFMYWEDVEFALRVRNLGYTFAVIGTTSVIHEVSSSHDQAGARINLYSTYGLVILAMTMSDPRASIGTIYRIIGRVLRTTSKRDWAAARATIDGAMLAARSKGTPGYQLCPQAGASRGE